MHDVSKESKATQQALRPRRPRHRRLRDAVPAGTPVLRTRRAVRPVQRRRLGCPQQSEGRLTDELAHAIDKPIAGLLTDLRQRGLWDETLVVWGGEFGRTPTCEGTDGRDHNPHGYTMWLAGGGVKAGLTYGKTDDYGYFADRWTSSCP